MANRPKKGVFERLTSRKVLIPSLAVLGLIFVRIVPGSEGLVSEILSTIGSIR
jgi:hypothetical protein